LHDPGSRASSFAGRSSLATDNSLKPRTKQHREERIAALLRTWPELPKLDLRKINKHQCLIWAASYSTSAINFNKTVQTLRAILEIPIESGIRYDNPAKLIKTMKVRHKPLQLPTRVQFLQLVSSVGAVNKRFRDNAP
jgi:hypothetical protein